jgi:hypothetical protein
MKPKNTASTTIWAVEDVNEYNYFSSHSKEEVIDFINNSKKILENDLAYLVVTYPDSKAIIPDDIKTVRMFMTPEVQV